MSAPDTKPSTPPASAPAAAEERGFLNRWSRRKRAAESGQPLPDPVQPVAEAQAPVAPVNLPDPTTLSFDDDFSAYLGAQVPAALKRAAMAKLFADPSFNKMDGLDTYIEDYNQVPDLPAVERDLLAHAREVLSPVPAPDREASPPANHAAVETAAPAPTASPPAAPEQPADPGDAAPPAPKA